MNQIVHVDFQGHDITFQEDGWFNATAAAAQFDKRPNDWLALASTQEYLAALDADSNTGKIGIWVRVKKGGVGGTWLHPDLAVQFARWLDVRFAIWCDRQIRALLTGSHPHFDQRRLRHEAAASYKVMSQMLQLEREEQGKPTAPYHYANEAKLVNWAVAGEFAPLDREQLSIDDLTLLSKVEQRNTLLLARGMPREDRKAILLAYAEGIRRLALPKAA
jgi:hypothetical protein